MIGEHIRALKGGRWVHAIDCGDDTVLHLAVEPSPGRVRRVYRPEFLAGAAAVEAVTHRERTFPPAEVVRRAYSRASDPALAAMFADSESFADWCTCGRSPAARNVVLAVPGVAAHAPPARRRSPRAARAAKGAGTGGGRAARTGKAKAPRPAPAPKRRAKGRRAQPGRVAPRRRAARRRRR
jgi:hypothetical protein